MLVALCTNVALMAKPTADRSGQSRPKTSYLAHCFWCGHDAEGEGAAIPHGCPRCGGRLFREIDRRPALTLPRPSRESARRHGGTRVPDRAERQ